MSRKVRPFGIRGLMFSCRKLAEKYGAKWYLDRGTVRLRVPEVGYFCPITATAYHRTGKMFHTYIPRAAAAYCGFETELIGPVVGAADYSYTSYVKIRKALVSLTK